MRTRLIILVFILSMCTLKAQVYLPNCTVCFPCIEPPVYDMDVQAYFQAHGAPFRPQQKVAINNFVLGLKADGLWDEIHAFYLLKQVLPNDTIPYWVYNLKDPRNSDEAYRLKYYNNNGIIVDRKHQPVYYTDEYITWANTNYVFTSANRSDKHLMVYTFANPLDPMSYNNNWGYQIGQRTIQNGALDAIAQRNRISDLDAHKLRVFLSDNNNSNIEYLGYGCHIASRINSTTVSASHNGVIVMDNVASNVVEAENGTPILIDYANGQWSYYTNHFASIGAGLTQSQMLAYDGRIQALNAAFKNEELEGNYYGLDFRGKYLMKNYNSGAIEIKRAEIDGFPIHIIAQRDGIKVALGQSAYGASGDEFFVSIDTGRTWTKRRFAPDDKSYASLARTMHIFKHGEIIFSTKNNKLWRSEDFMETITEVVLQNADGTPYVYHTPVNALYPGTYFTRWGSSRSGQVNGVEMFIWTNWGQSTFEPQGANPTNVYYSYGGDSVKIAYTYGYGPQRDNGTAAGSTTTGNFLGDPNNTISVFHGHNVDFNPIDTSFWAHTGEEGAHARWMRGKYNPVTDTWTWESVARGDVNGHFMRAASIWWKNDSLNWVSDAYQSGSTGIWRARDVNDLANARVIHPIAGDAGNTLAWGDTIVSGRASASQDRTIYYSNNGGQKWFQFTPYVQYLGWKSSGWLYPDADGWFAYQLYHMPYASWFFTGETYLIRFKF